MTDLPRGRIEFTDPTQAHFREQVEDAALVRERLRMHEERQRAERAEAQRDRLAQALRLLRDTSNFEGYAYNVAVRALDEAGVADPDEDHL